MAKPLQVGTIAYSVRSGLGILARDFYRHGVVTRIMVIPHGRYPEMDWYPGAVRYSKRQATEFLIGLDCLLLFENAFNHWDIVAQARAKGIRIVMMPMYEWTPQNLPTEPDFYLCPSLLDLKRYQDRPSIFLTVPVDVQWRERKEVRTYVHNAGHGGVGFRNGTPELLDALKYAKKPFSLIVRGQPSEPRMAELFAKAPQDERLQIISQEVAEDELYAEGDAFVFPEKYNGLSLPLQEAFASGMLVIGTDRFPMNTWLPLTPLITPSGFETAKMAVEVQKVKVDPYEIARHLDGWYGVDVSEFSKVGKEWAEAHSWAKMKPRYLSVLRGDK